MKISTSWGVYPVTFNATMKVCAGCGKKFKPKVPMQKYCKVDCRPVYKRRKPKHEALV